MKIVQFCLKEDKEIVEGYSRGFGLLVDEAIETDATILKVNTFRELKQFCDSIDNAGFKSTHRFNVNEVCFLPPVIPTNNVFCIGKNYYDHLIEFDGTEADYHVVKENPIFFTKPVSSMVGHLESVMSHETITNELDYEAELGVIIGRDCKDVTYEEAESVIFGYTIINDVTARDLQKKHQQWFKGKSLDSFCPVGPYLVTKDEISDPHQLEIVCKINDEIRQQDITGLMIHDIYSQIVELSKGMTLRAGDIISTGTPKGVGMGHKPPIFLKAGDTMEISISGLGTLSNKVI